VPTPLLGVGTSRSAGSKPHGDTKVRSSSVQRRDVSSTRSPNAAATRVLHVYVGSSADASKGATTAVRRWTEGGASVAVVYDLAWETVGHLRG
jgi:hypothetical protein